MKKQMLAKTIFVFSFWASLYGQSSFALECHKLDNQSPDWAHFISLEEIHIKNPRIPILILDTPGLSNETSGLNLRVIDHHGPFRDPKHPNRNTTSQLIDAFEIAEKEAAASKKSPKEILQGALAKIFQVSPSEIASNGVAVSTDNLGDAMTSLYLINHPEKLATPRDRRVLRLATFHEDFGTFGNRTRDIGTKSQEMAEALELAEAIMAIEDEIILKYRGIDKSFFQGSDRFGNLMGQQQHSAVAEIQLQLHQIFENPNFRKERSQKFAAYLHEAAQTVAKLFEKRDSAVFENARKILGEDFEAFYSGISFFNMEQIPKGGPFLSFSAVAMASEKPYQLRFQRMANGNYTYILTIPHGLRGFGLIDQMLVESIRAAGGGPGFIMRDSGLLFNFAGDPTLPKTIVGVLANKWASILKAKSGLVPAQKPNSPNP